MKSISILQDFLYRLGLLFLVVSAGLYCLPNFMYGFTEEPFGLFMVHYLLALVYLFTLLFTGKLRRGRNGLPHLSLFALLFFVSAYALNREFNVFDENVIWMQVVLIVTSVNLILLTLQLRMPFWLAALIYCIAGLAIVVYGYLAIYLLPIYGFGIVGALGLGIGLHTFVPLLLIFCTLKMLKQTQLHFPTLKWILAAGIALPLLYTAIFAIKWNSTTQKMERIYLKASTKNPTGWPAWVTTIQNTPVSPVTQKILKGGLLYSVAEHAEQLSLWNAPTRNVEDKMQHDPLIMVATFFAAPNKIPAEDRFKMLQATQSNKHIGEERLWRGDDLRTIRVETEAEIWPAMHLSYTENTYTVANLAPANTFRRQQQEAIYTFQLPEGAVVTALSLWINGVEEKSMLTTVGKAKTAYKTIVGVEQRDPSVVHWQEGNRVAVRVFPVIAGEQRIFKIGVTAPLPANNQQLVYQNITFNGPAANGALEQINIHLMEPIKSNVQLSNLTAKDAATFNYEGNFQNNWSVALPYQPVSTAAFNIDGKSYLLNNYLPQQMPLLVSSIYADVNQYWTNDEWLQIIKIAKGKKLKVFDDGWADVTENNQVALFSKLQQQRFSLFPFHLMASTVNSLVVTKGTGPTPSLDELKESSGFSQLVKATANGKKLTVFHIGNEPSLYARSLRECRLLRYDQGSIDTLQQLITNGLFPEAEENAEKVVLHDAKLTLSVTKDTIQQNAPDHLMRLFTYNHILQQGGPSLLTDTLTEQDSLVAAASYAHIVSPVSSMVVLESKADYERFGIKANKNGLQNAALQGKGAVPEPHEWLMILVALAIVFFVYGKQKGRIV